jgi:hypothetical protein
MQAQDFIAYFKDQYALFYQLTLENPAYAIGLALSVWLITSLLYSIRIGGLKKQIKQHVQALTETKETLSNAQNQIALLQGDVLDIEQQLEHEKQHVESLKHNLQELSNQISDSILALAAQPELGQQGLSVREGLSTEQLWLRFQAAVKQLSENLLSEVAKVKDLSEANQSAAAKVADKELQLQALKMRDDSLKQQIVKLELSLQEQTQLLDEQKQSLAEQTRLVEEQQQSAEQRILETEAKYQADISKLATLEQQYAKLEQKLVQQGVGPVSAVEKTKSLDVKKPEPLNPVEAEPVERPQPEVKSVISQAPVETPKAGLVEEKSQPNDAISSVTPATATSNASFGNRFKSFLGNAKQKIDKLDNKLGQRTELPQDLEEAEILKLEEPPVPEVVKVTPPTEVPAVAEVAPSTAGLGGKFKNLFGGSKAKATKAPVSVDVAAVEESGATAEPELGGAKTETANVLGKLKGLMAKKPVAVVKEQVEVEPESASQPEVAPAKAEAAKLLGKFKGLMAKKPTAVITELVEAEPVAESDPEPEPPVEVVTQNSTLGQVKNLFGKFGRKA